MTAATSPAGGEQEAHRLPRTVSPRRYSITIAPDLEAATFTGGEVVEVEVHEEVASIVLNAADLEVSSASIAPASDGGREMEGALSLDAEAERLTLTFADPVAAGTWHLHLAFSGTINDKLAGFYRSTFVQGAGSGEEGTSRTLAVTQFEATDARRAFPCWDEPDRKAVFSLTLRVPGGMAAVANTAVVEDRPAPGGAVGRSVTFADTMPMSTYLVAWVVGPLEATAPVDVDGVPLRVVHVPGKEHLTGFALEVGAHALRFFSEWFAIPYPGDKLDLVAIPDFAFGAMENLGAVTFRESLLLVDPASASRLELERIADVVSHEIAHMWFGDLVTMRWWNGLWLNEAFATFMETLAVDHFRPEWQRWVSFGRSRAAAFATDGLSSTRPVEYPVLRPEDAEGMFDVLTYEKGASVLRMLERYLGTGAFREGIRRYLGAHRHANAETTDLWDAIEEASGEPARATMDSWILQGGYPLVGVVARGSTLEVSQRPFRYGEPGEGPDAIGSGWVVPVLLRAGVEGQESPVEQRVLLGPGGATVEMPGPVEWVVANAGGHGFYRVHYEGDLLERLAADLSRLDALERFNLVSDTWAEAVAGSEDLAQVLGLLRRVAGSGETDPDVWSIAAGALDLLDRVVPEADRPALQAFARALAGPSFAEVGWDPAPGEDERRGTLRAVLLRLLGTVGADPAVRERAAALHSDALAGRAAVPPDLAPAIVVTVAATGGREEWEAFRGRFLQPGNPQEELRYLYGLAAFKDPELVSRTLDMSLTEVRTQNAPYLLAHLLANREAGPAAWRFVAAHWDEALARFPDNSIPRMLEPVSTLVQDGVAGEVRSFFAAHRLHAGQRTLEQSLERLDVNVAFGARVAPGMAGALGAG